LVTYPFSSVPEVRMRVVLAITWVVSSAGTVISLAHGSSSTFIPETGKCTSSIYENSKAVKILQIALAVIVIIPLFVITIVNFILCIIAVRSSRRAQNSQANFKALVMVCALSGLFIISWVPYVVYTLMKSQDPEIPPALDLLSFHCVFINSFGNPILYTLTNKRFGNYVRGLLDKVFCGLRGKFKRSPKDPQRANPTSSTNAKSATGPEEQDPSGAVTSAEGIQAL
jgi:hypothetical protein